jgi:type I restriction enzyme S subunit
MRYEKVKLNDICFSISDGDHQPPPKTDKGIPFVTISNITNTNQFDFSNTMFVAQEYYDRLDIKRKAQINDILYSVVGSFGIPVLIKSDTKFVFQRHIAILRPNSDKIVPKFLYYVMLSRDFYMMADVAAIGAAQRTVSLTSLRNMEISIPEIEAQKKIAETLSVYDDLIENNQKQIKLLEEAAQRLYKEWFVNLRFPGYEDVAVVDGVPEGWEYKLVSEFGEVITGKTPSTSKSEYYGGTIPFVTIPDMHGKVYPLTTEKSLTKAGADTQKNKYLPANTVIVSCIATVGLVNIAVEPCQTNQQINSVVLSNNNDLYFFYESMLRIKALLDGVGSNGATMTNVNKTKFSNIKVLYPTENLILKYDQFCKPIFEKIFSLSKAILILEQARDRLLPKLMSGELEV